MTGSGLRPDTPKSVAPYATLFPRIDLLRQFVSDCFSCFFFIYLSHPGCDNVVSSWMRQRATRCCIYMS
ncbi:hypothetical protein B6P55_25945 [Escherichia coli]|nr:hypothetical protein [Escherichia coli]